jgi:hypothetical protein
VGETPRPGKLAIQQFALAVSDDQLGAIVKVKSDQLFVKH